MTDLNLSDLRNANLARCEIPNESFFHPIKSWSPTDWATALAGECGELCNLVKKMRRIVSEPENLPHNEDITPYALLVKAAAEEMADTLIYLDLLAARLHINLSDAVIRKFNKDSTKRLSNIRL